MHTSFLHYLLQRMPANEWVAAVCEVSELFPRDEINQIFKRETDKLLQRTTDQEQTTDLMSFKQMDHVGYIDRSVRNAGVRDPDIDPLVQDLVVKLLMGSLFTNYVGQPMVPRFKVAVTNAIRTMAKKRSRFEKRFKPLEDDVVQRNREPALGSDLLSKFRAYLRQAVGPTAVTVLDQRLDGNDTKDLIGTQGLETSYRLKQVVGQLKTALHAFAANDPEFQEMIQRALADEQATLRKRFSSRGESRSGV